VAGYITDQAALDKAAGEMLNTNEQLMSQMQKMASELDPLKTAWKGQAATAFQDLIDHFLTDAKTLNDSLDQIANNVSANAKAYAAQEEQQQQELSQITSTLGG
jgi:WXG100 family type VII secretion target